MSIVRQACACLAACLLATRALAVEPAPDEAPRIERGIAYRTGAGVDAYQRQRCVVDLYLPVGRTGFATLVWFHGGGLVGGSKDDPDTVAMARRFARDGVAVALPNYRFSPTVAFPAYVEDAAACVAWVARHIAERGGAPTALVIGGHSGGGYLASIAVMDARFLAAAGVPPTAIAGLVPVSGQTVTHVAVAKERGVADPRANPHIDDAAPQAHVRKDAPPVLAICADQDMARRADENRAFIAKLKDAGHAQATYLEIADRDHSSILGRMRQAGDPAAEAILAFIAARCSR